MMEFTQIRWLFQVEKKEPGDLDLKETAVRETVEELGLLKKNIVIQKELI